MSGGESSAPTFGGNRGGERGSRCHLGDSGSAKQPAGNLGEQSSRRPTPPGLCPPSGDELQCLGAAETPVQLCQGAETPAPSFHPLVPPRGSSGDPEGSAHLCWVRRIKATWALRFPTRGHKPQAAAPQNHKARASILTAFRTELFVLRVSCDVLPGDGSDGGTASRAALGVNAGSRTPKTATRWAGRSDHVPHASHQQRTKPSVTKKPPLSALEGCSSYSRAPWCSIAQGRFP